MEKRLHLRGWSKKEINHANSIFAKAEHHKHRHVALLENSLFWFTLATGIVGNLILSLVLIPIFIAGNDFFTYLLTALFGFLLGTIVFGIVKHMRWLASHHHLFLALLIPLLGIFNFFFVVQRVNSFNLSIGLKNFHDPWIVGVVYFVSFALPYGFLLLTRRL